MFFLSFALHPTFVGPNSIYQPSQMTKQNENEKIQNGMHFWQKTENPLTIHILTTSSLKSGSVKISSLR